MPVAPPNTERRASLLHAFSFGGYRWLWVASLLTWTSLQMQNLSRGYLARQLTDSPFLVTAVFAAGSLPILLAPLAGAVADRIDRKRLIFLADLVTIGITITTPILITLDVITLPILMSLGFVSGLALTAALPARQAMIADLVDQDSSAGGAVLFTGLFNGALIGGPALAGFIIDAGGLEAAYYTALGLSGLGMIALIRLPRLVRPATKPESSAIQTFVEGLRYVWRSPLLVLLLTGAVMVTMFSAPYSALLPIFQRDVLHVDAGGLGWMQAAVGAGSLLAALTLSLGASHTTQVRRMSFLGIAASLSVAAFSQSDIFLLSLVLLLLVGLFQSGYMVINMAMVQNASEREYQGRVFSMRILVWGIAPIGQLAIGAAASVHSPQMALGAFGLVAAGSQIFLAMGLRGATELKKPTVPPPEG